MTRALWLLTGVLFASLFGHLGYVRLIAGPAAREHGRSALIWLEQELELDAAQANRARALHEEWKPQLETLRQQLEQERRSAQATGNQAACLAAEALCKVTTAQLVQQMNSLLAPAQRQKYLSLVADCLPPTAPASAASQPADVSSEPPARR